MAETVICIPARWGSSRFPGKPLASIAGRTLLSRVIDLARACAALVPDSEILVATDDDRVAAEADRCRCSWVMTDPAIASGSGRALAAASNRRPTPSYIVNLQGDAPFVGTGAVLGIIAALRRGANVATPVVQLSWAALDAMRDHKERAPFSGTSCVRDQAGRALWFSKQIIPALRSEQALRLGSPLSPVFRHVGVYGYTYDALRRFEAAPMSRLELLEGLEQLRFFELGIPIEAVLIAEPALAMSGIDTPADAAQAEAFIARHGEPVL